MTPASLRDKRADCWKIFESRFYVPMTTASILATVQRIVTKAREGGVKGTEVIYALESLLQRCGRPQRLACCICQGQGVVKSEVTGTRTCSEGCRPPREGGD